jgi:hypothetical protein
VLPGAGTRRNRRRSDPAFHRGGPDAHGVVGRQADGHRGVRREPREARACAPEDRHGHGAHRRALGPGREAPRSGRAREARGGGGHLHALRGGRRAGPHGRAQAARALQRGALVLHASLAAHADAARRQLGRHPAHAGVAPRHGASGHPLLRGVPGRGPAPHHPPRAGAPLGDPRRVLQGGGAGPARVVRRHLGPHRTNEAHHAARRLRRRLRARDERQSGGARARSAPPRRGADLHGPNHGGHRLEQRLQRRRSGAPRTFRSRANTDRRTGPMGRDHST